MREVLGMLPLIDKMSLFNDIATPEDVGLDAADFELAKGGSDLESQVPVRVAADLSKSDLTDELVRRKLDEGGNKAALIDKMSLFNDIATPEDVGLDAADFELAKGGSDLESQVPVRVAADLSKSDLTDELVRRKLDEGGFGDAPAKRLQIAFDAERQEKLNELVATAADSMEADRKTLAAERNKTVMARLLGGEITAFEGDDKLHVRTFVRLLLAHATKPRAFLGILDSSSSDKENRSVVAPFLLDPEVPRLLPSPLSSTTARIIAKGIAGCRSLIFLDLGDNRINDLGGCFLARSLRHNQVLQQLELGGNLLGPRTLAELGRSLMPNSGSVPSALKGLNIESNPVTANGADLSGVEEFSDMLEHNTTLRSLNFFRCDLGNMGARMLAEGIRRNVSVHTCDIGFTGDTTADTVKQMAEALRANQASLADVKANDRLLQEVAAKEAAAQLLAEQKEERRLAYLQWMEDEKAERVAERLKELDAQRTKRIEAELKLKEEADRAAAQKAAEEAEKGKKKKKGKGKKK
eukprot:CAMPEP_0114336504 /NCGR_PEP_ID=MMETSP0101-20121206/5751_1 /TAXON_ID=38822 ORGANISM="Pteridomonas danica, Strain PT" /NCGR_SAMPLE_ID=MMETSP0101 /ASSEMBLY_ACC=CAM_ASM_000211 /LENGTH=524 /DNA_ID=CAMNT_0001468449 /DNA_START=1 /DNA_END=1576 /DNA_ORIENTATION=-